MQIRLTRKFCDVLNGLDLRPFAVGQVIDMKDPLAAMLIAEGWADRIPSATADDGPRTRKADARRRFERT